MNNKRKFVACVVSLLVIAGCADQQKRVVRPSLDTAVRSQPLPAMEEQQQTNDEEAASKTIVQPYAITLPPGEGFEGEVAQGPLPTINTVNDRIFEYGRKLDRWKELDRQSAAMELDQRDTERMVNCFVDLQKVLGGYSQLRADMLQLNSTRSAIVINSADVLDLQKSDISFLESVCGRLLAPAEAEMIDWEQREEDADLPQLEALIERYSGNREYEEVVQVWQRIPDQQTGRVHLRTKILYGNALMFLHQEERAAEMYQQIVDEMSASDEQRTDLLSLRKMLADLYTAAGNYPAAKNQYQNMSDDYKSLASIEEWSKLQLDILDRSEEGGPELKEFSALLRNFLGFIPERDGFKIVWEADGFLQKYPYSAVASNVDFIRKAALAGADKWFNGFFADVEQLAGEKKYVDAIEILETIPADIVSVEQKEQIKTRNDDLILAEAVERETRKIEKMQELQRQWNEGMLLVDDGRYDEAIVVFKSLLQTEYFAKAEDKIEEVVLLAAKTDRRAAADLYIRYTKTSDLEMKKKLLLETHKLLSEILVKYPDVNIIDKVKGNIEKVEEEMNLLDPMLLQTMETVDYGPGEPVAAKNEEDVDLSFSLPGQTQAAELPPKVQVEDLTQ